MSRHEIHSAEAHRNHHDGELDPRTRRALEEAMDVLFVGVGTYVVHAESGNRYEVDVFETSCTCPDWWDAATPERCKHIRRVDMEIDAGTVPRPDGRIADDQSVAPDPRSTVPQGQGSSTVAENRISGPIPEFDRYGRSTATTYWRCETCGREAIRKRDLTEICRASDDSNIAARLSCSLDQ